MSIKRTLVAATLAGGIAYALVETAQAQQPSPMEYCQYWGGFAYAVAGDRDAGVTVPEVAAGVIGELRSQGYPADSAETLHHLSVIELAYAEPHLDPIDERTLTYQACMENISEPEAAPSPQGLNTSTTMHW